MTVLDALDLLMAVLVTCGLLVAAILVATTLWIEAQDWWRYRRQGVVDERAARTNARPLSTVDLHPDPVVRLMHAGLSADEAVRAVSVGERWGERAGGAEDDSDRAIYVRPVEPGSAGSEGSE